MKNFNEYLRDAGIDPQETAMCFHKPVERAFARFLPHIAAHTPELLEAYQSSHSDRASLTLSERRYMASFVGLSSGRMAFVGLYKVIGAEQRPVADICAIPEVQQLYQDYAVDEEFFDGFSQSWLWFDLERESVMGDFKGRLQIEKPAIPDYMQRADRIDTPVIAVADSPVLEQPIPQWDELVLVSREVKTLPPMWRDTLSAWQGVYLITDTHGGARYVGTSTPKRDLLSQWQAHIQGKISDTEKLSLRNPTHFRFSILERLAQDVSEADLTARKASWIKRLGTADFGLNDKP